MRVRIGVGDTESERGDADNSYSDSFHGILLILILALDS